MSVYTEGERIACECNSLFTLPGHCWNSSSAEADSGTPLDFQLATLAYFNVTSVLQEDNFSSMLLKGTEVFIYSYNLQDYYTSFVIYRTAWNNAVGGPCSTSVWLLLCDREHVTHRAVVMSELQAAQRMNELDGRAESLIWGFLM